eukprot:26308_5
MHPLPCRRHHSSTFYVFLRLLGGAGGCGCLAARGGIALPLALCRPRSRRWAILDPKLCASMPRLLKARMKASPLCCCLVCALV